MYTVEAKNVSFQYSHQTKALKDITFRLTREKVVILGNNGSGKSTLLQHLNGLLISDQGELYVLGEKMTKKNATNMRKKVGFVFDHPENQLFAITVYEDIAFGPRNLGCSEKEVKEKVERALALLSIEELRDKAPYHLSLGQKKKVAIAGVLAMNPSILLFDEPFSGLDPQSVEQLLTILERLYEEGHTLIVTTHDVDIAYGWAEECLILHDGQLIAHGDIHVMEDKQVMKKARLKVPSLFSLFEHTSYRPRTIEKAKEIMEKYVMKEEFSV